MSKTWAGCHGYTVPSRKTFLYPRPVSGMSPVSIPTEPIGSIPRPGKLLAAIVRKGATNPELDSLYDEAIEDTIRQFEATGSPVVTDGEQRKYHNFWTYCVHGLPNMAAGWLSDPLLGGTRATNASAAQRPFSLPAACRQLSGRCSSVRYVPL